MTKLGLNLNSIIDSLLNEASIDSIWDQFATFSERAKVHSWSYFLLPPFEEQFYGTEAALRHEYLQHASKSSWESLGFKDDEDISKLKKLLRHVEEQTAGTNFVHAPEISKILDKNGQTIDLGSTYFVPVFGPRSFNGCFIITTSREDELDKIFSVICQVLHTENIRELLKLNQTKTSLTRRETEILQAISKGLSNSKIAEQLSISPYTVNGYLQRIFLKIGAQDRTTAVLIGLAYGLIR